MTSVTGSRSPVTWPDLSAKHHSSPLLGCRRRRVWPVRLPLVQCYRARWLICRAGRCCTARSTLTAPRALSWPRMQDGSLNSIHWVGFTYCVCDYRAKAAGWDLLSPRGNLFIFIFIYLFVLKTTIITVTKVSYELDKKANKLALTIAHINRQFFQ